MGRGVCSQLGWLSLAKASTSVLLGLAALLSVAGSRGEQEVSPPGLLGHHSNSRHVLPDHAGSLLCAAAGEVWLKVSQGE